MICYLLAMEKQHLGPHVVVGYGIKIFWPGLFITSPDHLALCKNHTDGPAFNGPIVDQCTNINDLLINCTYIVNMGNTFLCPVHTFTKTY